MSAKNIIKRIAWGLLIVLVLFGILNFDYLWKNLLYTFSKPKAANTIQETAQQKLGANFLQIESLGIATPVIYVNELSEKVYQEALKKGVVHFPATALPGQLGNAYIFGHSSDYIWSTGKYKTVFALLPRIEIGAKILITDNDGNLYIYTVIDKVIANPNDVQYLDQNGYKRRILTLQTSYPIGTALKRYIVIAELK